MCCQKKANLFSFPRNVCSTCVSTSLAPLGCQPQLFGLLQCPPRLLDSYKQAHTRTHAFIQNSIEQSYKDTKTAPFQQTPHSPALIASSCISVGFLLRPNDFGLHVHRDVGSRKGHRARWHSRGRRWGWNHWWWGFVLSAKAARTNLKDNKKTSWPRSRLQRL